jgi:5-formyltetrahydrofolate cyclo-ligase
VSAKTDLRRELLARRRAIEPEAYTAAGRAIQRHLADLATGIEIVAAYLPLPTEPGGPAWAFAAAFGGRTLLLPCLRPDDDLDWATLRYAAGPDGEPRPHLRTGRRAMSEPVGPLLGVQAIATAGLVVVPATAVDGHGNRLGRGGGSYDRALARVTATTPVAAVVFDHEVLECVPTDDHDRRVTVIVAPAGIRRVS